ncbi:MAG: transcriptional repressor [Chthonomonadales bacterium]|nr:transcriptional repressor [Chthonomonadales bacterium]
METPALCSLLADRGVRITRQRRIVLDLLENTPGHVTASTLLRVASQVDPGINRATVYRTLALLKAEGLIDELDLMHLAGAEHYYERRRVRVHVHIGCTSCGRIIEMETDHVERLLGEVRRKTGFAPEWARVEVGALCPACRKA